MQRFKAALPCGSWSKEDLVEDSNGDFIKYKDFIEVKEVALALLEYIDAIPDEIDFKKTMPGIDRDWVDSILND